MIVGYNAVDNNNIKIVTILDNEIVGNENSRQ